MKTIKIVLPPERKNVHDGLGGVHVNGDVVELPDETADALVAMKLAAFADTSSAIDAAKAHKERADLERMAQQKARARSSMAVHDSLPADVRAAVHEHGDDVTEDYLAGIAREHESETLPGLPEPRRRGRPRKIRPEGGDA